METPEVHEADVWELDEVEAFLAYADEHEPG